jgi:hypothetical protein
MLSKRMPPSNIDPSERGSFILLARTVSAVHPIPDDVLP